MKSLDKIQLYCFSPGKFLKDRDPVELISAQIRGGTDVIQLREKEMSKRDRLELGLKIRELTRQEGVLFIVNDDVDLALILDADGVHLGQDDIPIRFARPLMKDKIIGVSTHSLNQAEEAVASGADYIGVGPVFETATKEDREDLVGLNLLPKIKDICPIPYVAIGGIGKDNIASLAKAGCHRAAVISDIMLAPDIEQRCRMIKKLLGR
ncbi:MAG: thiamine phosphate synthase [Deltaproteobacteria bacterium]|nr:thiamine phosphate synthase [Deltaproteobacteria bacterium]